VLLAAGSCLAQADQLADIKHMGEIVCGVLGTDEPMSFVDPQSRTLVGYDVDLCGVIARKLGVTANVRQIAVAARIPELQEGRVSILAANLTHTREREAMVSFSLTTFVTGRKVMVRRDGGLAAVAQLAGRKIVTVKGGTQQPNIRKAVPTAEVVTFQTAPEALVALEQHKAAGFVNDEAALLDAYAKPGPQQKDYLILPQSISTESIALGLRKNEPALLAVVNDALRELEVSGRAQGLFFKWFGPGTRLQYQTRSFNIDIDRIAD